MKKINEKAPVSAKNALSIQAPAARVWEVLTDIDRWAEWQQDITLPKLQGSLAPGAVFTWKTGGAPITSTLHTVDKPLAFGWTGKTFGMLAIHNWTLHEQNGVTEVRVEESMEGLLAKLLKKSFQQNLEGGMLRWLEALKATAER